MPPQSLLARKLSDYEVELSWQPPLEANSDILYYVVRVWWVSDSTSFGLLDSKEARTQRERLLSFSGMKLLSCGRMWRRHQWLLMWTQRVATTPQSPAGPDLEMEECWFTSALLQLMQVRDNSSSSHDVVVTIRHWIFVSCFSVLAFRAIWSTAECDSCKRERLLCHLDVAPTYRTQWDYCTLHYLLRLRQHCYWTGESLYRIYRYLTH